MSVRNDLDFWRLLWILSLNYHTHPREKYLLESWDQSEIRNCNKSYLFLMFYDEKDESMWCRVWGRFHFQIRCLVISCTVLMRWDLYAESSNCFEIWQEPPQHCCGGTCQITKQYDFNYQSCRLKTSYHLMIKCLIEYWNAPLVCFWDRILLALCSMWLCLCRNYLIFLLLWWCF